MAEQRRIFVENVYWVDEFVPVRPTLSLRLGAHSDGEELTLPLYHSPLFTVYNFLCGDLDPDLDPTHKTADIMYCGPFFTPGLAGQLFDAVAAHPECLDVFINCHAAYSRSPAVAGAFAEVFGWEFEGWREGKYSGYNRYMYRLMLEEARRRRLYAGKIPVPNLTGHPLACLFLWDSFCE